MEGGGSGGEESDFNSFYLQRLFLSFANPALRTIFKRRWYNETQKLWIKSKQDFNQLVVLVRFPNNLKSKQQLSLQTMDEELWDMTLLNIILSNWRGTVDAAQTKTENALIQQLVQIRNEVVHHADGKIPQALFDQLWNASTTILIELGQDADEMNLILVKKRNKFSSRTCYFYSCRSKFKF
eukprot:TRINITY_DN4492_c0_g1_i2.p1 TRINITY_DN4492_c0_g1~~TRINITY_DN4492_c0_g1_i2.p1  ORF type:complete len:182 (-),score=41.22 TRINITY_DN4492_c0_g1_i2:195-740(-)